MKDWLSDLFLEKFKNNTVPDENDFDAWKAKTSMSNYWLFSVVTALCVVLAKLLGLVSSNSGYYDKIVYDLLDNGELILLGIAIISSTFGQFLVDNSGNLNPKQRYYFIRLIGYNVSGLIVFCIMYGFVYGSTNDDRQVSALIVSVLIYYISIQIGKANVKGKA